VTERDQTCCTASRPSNSKIQTERDRERVSDRERSDMLYIKQALKLKNPDRERERESG